MTTAVALHALLLLGAVASTNNRVVAQQIRRIGGETSAVTVYIVSIKGVARAADSSRPPSPMTDLFQRLAQDQPRPAQDPGARTQAADADALFNDIERGEQPYDPGARAGRRFDDDPCPRERGAPGEEFDQGGKPPCRRS